MIFGYARVSTDDQSLDRQIDALNAYGVDELLTEKMTGTKRSRPELDRLLDKLRSGDTVVLKACPDWGAPQKTCSHWWSILKNRAWCLSV